MDHAARARWHPCVLDGLQLRQQLIEVSCVSVAMLILVGSIEPALAMLGVPLLGYFLMLITSSLKLDSALCVFRRCRCCCPVWLSCLVVLG